MALAFAYVRASTQETPRQGSKERQKEAIRQYVESRGYEFKFFEDKAKLGKKTMRMEFERMLKSLVINPHAPLYRRLADPPVLNGSAKNS